MSAMHASSDDRCIATRSADPPVKSMSTRKLCAGDAGESACGTPEPIRGDSRDVPDPTPTPASFTRPVSRAMTPNRFPQLVLMAVAAIATTACSPNNDAPSPSNVKTDTAMDAPVAESTKRPATPESPGGSQRQMANAKPDDAGRLDVEAAGHRFTIEGCRLTRETDTVAHCEGDTHVVLTRGGNSTTVMLTSLYLDSASTFYRGPLDADTAKKGHSFILTDVDGDGHDDLIVWTGRDGAYGGPSYDVLLFDPAAGEFSGAPAFSELTVGANSLFSIEGGRLLLSSTDGCCTRYFDTYAVEGREPQLVERVTEEREKSSESVRRKVERLVDGELKEVG